MASMNWASICDRFNAGRSINEFLVVSVLFKNATVPKKVQLLYELYEEDHLLPQFKKTSGKSATLAAKYRKEGNYAFRNKRYVEAVKLYTESVATAPVDASDELVLAFSNRSAALFRLGKFALALVDVNRSLKLKHPKFLEDKLQRRKSECISRIRSGNVNKSYLELLAVHSEADVNPVVGFDEDVSDVNYTWKFTEPPADLRNELLPGASEKIKLQESEEMGRHMVAVRDINPGELLLSTKPFVLSLFPESYHTHCSNCGIKCEILIPCEGCSLVMFCGQRCRSEAFIRYHRIECEYLSFAVSLEQRKVELLTLRLLMVVTKQGAELRRMMEDPVFKDPFAKEAFNVNETFDPEDSITIHSLDDNFVRMPAQEKFERAAMAAMLVHILKKTTYFDDAHKEHGIPIMNTPVKLTDVECFTGALLLKYLCLVNCNVHYIGENEKEPKVILSKSLVMSNTVRSGVALYPFLCFLNHSCDSNVFRHTSRNHAVLYSVQPIAAGEQLFDDYGAHYLAETKGERQFFLKDQFYFDCKCDPCKFNWPLYVFLPQKNPKYLHEKINAEQIKKSSKRFSKLFQKFQSGLCVDEEFDFLCEHLTLLHKNIRKPWMEYAHCQETVKRLIVSRLNNEN